MDECFCRHLGTDVHTVFHLILPGRLGNKHHHLRLGHDDVVAQRSNLLGITQLVRERIRIQVCLTPGRGSLPPAQQAFSLGRKIKQRHLSENSLDQGPAVSKACFWFWVEVTGLGSWLGQDGELEQETGWLSLGW